MFFDVLDSSTHALASKLSQLYLEHIWSPWKYSVTELEDHFWALI